MSTLQFKVLTLFPEFFDGFLKTSLVGRAITAGLVSCECVNIRDFGTGKRLQVDDALFGGGEGMLLQKEVLMRAHDTVHPSYTILLSPRGTVLTQKKVRELLEISKQKEAPLTLVCGHYEGVDQRFIDTRVDAEISVGDYILSGGESAATVLLDAMIRLQENVVGNPQSVIQESFENHLLEHHHYTRPNDRDVPDVLVSGNHEAIAKWRKQNSLGITYERRPELLKTHSFSKAEEDMLKCYIEENFSLKTQK